MPSLLRPRLLVFDLDGTLIDSQVDLANTINAMLTHYGQPALPHPVIASYIGDGAQELVRRALAHAGLLPHADEALLAEALAWFIAWYRIHKLDHTYTYPGVVEALEQIRTVHPTVLMAVLTNKPVAPSRAICKHFGLDRFCFQVYGGDSFSTKKPAPEGLRALIAEASALLGSLIHPHETVMIGDSHIDIETARACGTQALGCTYGLSPASLHAAAPDLLVDHPKDWPQALNLT